MSGPKISVYALTGRAREIAFGQIRCEQQSLTCAAQTQKILKDLLSTPVNFEQQRGNVQLLIQRTGSGAEQLEKIEHLRKTLKRDARELDLILRANMPRVSTKYWLTEEAYAKKQAELQKLQGLQKRAEELKGALDEVLGNASRVQAHILRDLVEPAAEEPAEDSPNFLKRGDAQDLQQIQRSIVVDLSGVYSFDLPDEPEAPDARFEDRKNELHRELSTLLRDDSLPQGIVEEVKQALARLQMIADMQNLATYSAITVMGLLRRVDAYRREHAQRQAEYEELLLRYRALCAMANEEARELPFSEENKAAISAEIERLERMLVRQQEQAYIAECVDDVMKEMGYDLIGSREVRKRSGKQFKNELYTFREGTAVNVTFSPDGQISMELGGLAREDRIPTEEESEALTRDMQAFCGEFAEFERRLKERGVIVGNRIALSPPSAEYATIINVNDYRVGEGIQISEMNAKEQRRRAAEKKVMRRDGEWNS